MLNDAGRIRRLLALTAASAALIVVSGGSVALAGDGPPAPTAPAAAATSAPGATAAPAAADGNPFDAAVQALVDDGTIDVHQADVLRRHIAEGSIDPQALVDGGVLTAAQMQVVETRLTAVKQSLAGPATDRASAPSGTTKTPEGDANRTAATAAHAAFDAAVQALVADGTIDQAQADVLLERIDAGSIDEQQLIDDGTLTAAQMEAVRAQLSAVKQSFASGSSGAGSTSSPASKDSSGTR